MRLEDMQDLFGRTVYLLRAGQVQSHQPEGYVYRIYPVELKIKEIRFGEANRQFDEEYYGPGFVTWLCQNTNGIALYAFSPVGDEILGNTITAGRKTRAFFDKEDLYAEAEILRDCVLKNYKHVNRVEIGLPERNGCLENKIQDACVRSGFGSGSINEALLSYDKELKL